MPRAVDSDGGPQQRRVVAGFAFRADIIAFAAMLSPDLFRSAVVMGANLKLDFFYLWLSRMKKQTFAEFKGIADAIPANAKGVECGERPGWEMELIPAHEWIDSFCPGGIPWSRSS